MQTPCGNAEQNPLQHALESVHGWPVPVHPPHVPLVQVRPAGHPGDPSVQHESAAIHADPHCFSPGRGVHLPFLHVSQRPHGVLHFFFFFFFASAGSAWLSTPASATPMPARRETKRLVSASK